MSAGHRDGQHCQAWEQQVQSLWDREKWPGAGEAGSLCGRSHKKLQVAQMRPRGGKVWWRAWNFILSVTRSHGGGLLLLLLLVLINLRQREREKNIYLLFHLFMHSSVDSSVCPDQISNPQPWRIGTTLQLTELHGWLKVKGRNRARLG